MANSWENYPKINLDFEFNEKVLTVKFLIAVHLTRKETNNENKNHKC